jgi:hypothetical protein
MAARKPASASVPVQSAAPAQPSREQFIREYMAQLSANRPPKMGLVDRIAMWGEDRVVSATKNSRRTIGRLSAAWEISEQIRDEAYAEEHARHAESLALRLGLK